MPISWNPTGFNADRNLPFQVHNYTLHATYPDLMFVVAICSLKGGVGKTSTVLGLASAALHHRLRTLIVDLDPQSSVSLGMNAPLPGLGEPTLVDVLSRRGQNLQQISQTSPWIDPTDPKQRLDLLTGGPGLADLEGPQSAPRAAQRMAHRLRLALDAVEKEYDLVLIDCPPALGALTVTGMSCCHRTLIVTEPTLFSVSATDQLLKAVTALRQGGATQLQANVVVNKYRSGVAEHQYRMHELEKLYGALVITPPIPDRPAMVEAQGSSEPLHRWRGATSRDLATLFEGLLHRLIRPARSSRRGVTRTDDVRVPTSTADLVLPVQRRSRHRIIDVDQSFTASASPR